jgi:hypothetical protein
MIGVEGKNVYNKLVPKDEKNDDLILVLEDFPSGDDDQIIESVDDIVEVHDERILVDDPLREDVGGRIEVNRVRYQQWLEVLVAPGDDVDPNDVVRVDNLQGEKIPVLRAVYEQWMRQQVILVDDPTFGVEGVKIGVDPAKYHEWLRNQPPPGDDVDQENIVHVDNPLAPGQKIPVLRAAYVEWIEQQRRRND